MTQTHHQDTDTSPGHYKSRYFMIVHLRHFMRIWYLSFSLVAKPPMSMRITCSAVSLLSSLLRTHDQTRDVIIRYLVVSSFTSHINVFFQDFFANMFVAKLYKLQS